MRKRHQNWIKIIFVILLVLLGLIIGIRFCTGEDDWRCQNGQWVKHGHPSAPAPTSACK